MKTQIAWALAVFFLVSHTNGRLEAYLDPGTGSMALQAILGTVVGTLTLLRMYRERLKDFLSRLNSSSSHDVQG